MGAGVSMSSGLPSWAGLLKRLVERLASQGLLSEALDLKTDKALRDFVVEKSSEMAPIITARYLRAVSGDSRSFAYEVYNALYDDLIEQPTPSKLVLSLASLSECSRIYLNYNFDNLLEIAFSKTKRQAKAIWNERCESFASGSVIYHPHGYLPYGGESITDSHLSFDEVVLSEDAYHREYLNPFSWRNMVQVKCLYEGTGLLVGLSGNDPNLRRILEIASANAGRRHYVVLQKDSPPFGPAWNRLQARVFLELGLEVLWTNSYDDVPGLVAEIVAG